MKKIFLLIICSLVLVGLMSPTNANGQFFVFENPLVGEKAPDFTLKSTNGEKVVFKEFRAGKRVIMFFWATWCPHCRKEIMDLVAQMDEFDQNNIKLLLIDIGEPEGVVKQYILNNKIKYDVLLDESSEVAYEYGLVGVPMYYMVDEEGIVRLADHMLPEDYMGVFSKKSEGGAPAEAKKVKPKSNEVKIGGYKVGMDIDFVKFGLKVLLFIWIIFVPIAVTSRLDKIVKILEEKKK